MSWETVDWELFRSEIQKTEPPPALPPEEGWMSAIELEAHFHTARRRINEYIQRGLDGGVLECATGERKDRLGRIYQVLVYRWKPNARNND